MHFPSLSVDAVTLKNNISLERKWEPARTGQGEPDGLVFHGGSARLLERELGYKGDEILYFGDHTYGDILRSKKNLGWRTAMVVEELKHELEVTRRMLPRLAELDHWKALRGVLESDTSNLEIELRKWERRLESEGKGKNAARVRHKVERLRERLRERQEELEEVSRRTTELGDAINRSYNPHWGPLFREGRETSRFGHQVKDFACLYMTRVSNFLHYNRNHYFRSAAERMPHELE